MMMSGPMSSEGLAYYPYDENIAKEIVEKMKQAAVSKQETVVSDSICCRFDLDPAKLHNQIFYKRSV